MSGAFRTEAGKALSQEDREVDRLIIMPWVSLSRSSSAKPLFAITTWIRIAHQIRKPFTVDVETVFNELAKVFGENSGEGCVGFTSSMHRVLDADGAPTDDWYYSTYSVWRAKADMLAFVRSAGHAKYAKKWMDRHGFGESFAKEFSLTRSELPTAGDEGATREWIKRVKMDEFPPFESSKL